MNTDESDFETKTNDLDIAAWAKKRDQTHGSPNFFSNVIIPLWYILFGHNEVLERFKRFRRQSTPHSPRDAR